MSGKKPAENGTMTDKLIWVSVVSLISAGIAAYYYFSDQLLVIRAVALLAVFAVALLLSHQTILGKQLWVFAKESKNEIRKVVWPTRQETLQATIMVMITVLIAGFILWAVDSILLRLIAWLTGH